MSSLIGAYARVLMPHRGPTSSGTESTDVRETLALPSDPLSLSFSSAIYRAICWLERVAKSARIDQRRSAKGELGTFDA